MKIVLIGSGNVASHLGQALYNKKHSIAQVFSRNIDNATQLAQALRAEAIDDLSKLQTDADLYIISVKDDVLESVIGQIPLVKGLVVHTAGSVDMKVLARFENYGVFYPFQTFTKDTAIDFSTIPMLVESPTDANLQILHVLASELSSNVIKASSEQRAQLHIAAVYACNFVNHMYRLSEEVLAKCDLPFSLLYPLIKETANKVIGHSPSKTQTGPASRNDQKIINKHLAYLKDDEELSDIYKVLTASVLSKMKSSV